MSPASTMATASTSMMPATVRWRLPAVAWRRFHRRNVTVTDPSRIPSTKRSSNSTVRSARSDQHGQISTVRSARSDQRRAPVAVEPVGGEAEAGHTYARLDLLIGALVASVLDAPLAGDLDVL